VAKSNIGTWAALVAAAALIIDYVLTVAVSTAAGIAAITSAVPVLFPHREALGLMTILMVVVMNLRGVRESGRIFAIPTYLFIGSFLLMIGTGMVQLYMGKVPTINPPLDKAAIEGVSIFLILRAFSSGCTALTGIEVISNGVSAFKKPEPHNAAVTMLGMAAVLGILFVGTSVLALQYGVIAKEDETVVSQIARLTFGEGTMYFLIQAATMAILILAANTRLLAFLV
jgi:amino acid transporter